MIYTSGCIELLSKYNSQNQVDIRNPNTKDYQISKKDKQANKRRHIDRTIGPAELAENLTTIKYLLDPVALGAELEKIQQEYLSPKPKHYYSSRGPITSSLDLWAKQFDENVQYTELLAVLPQDTTEAAYLQFQILQSALDTLDPFSKEIRRIDVIKRALRYEQCLSLVKVFEWDCKTGPLTAQYLMRVHKSHGSLYLCKDSPQFAKLIDHIVRYVQTIREEYLLQKAQKKSGSSSSQEQQIVSSSSGLPDSKSLSIVPGDLYGLRKSSQNKPFSDIRLKIRKMSDLKPGNDALYAISEICFLELLSDEIIAPKLRHIDEEMSGPRIKSYTNTLIYQRCITRGAILWSIANACGSNGVFASSRIDEFITSPAIIFKAPLSDFRKFAPEVLKKKEATLEPLLVYITSHLAENPNVAEIAQKLGVYSDHQMAELYCRKQMPLIFPEENEDDEDDDISKEANIAENAHTAVSTKTQRNKKNKSQNSPVNSISVTFESLIPPDVYNNFSLALPAIILREALNFHRSLPPGNEIARRILLGRPPLTSSSQMHNPDHTNPIRELTIGATLFKQHLPAFRVTSRVGISNLLSYLGTGQGYTTQNFLQTLDKLFFASSLQEMIETFQTAIKTNVTCVINGSTGRFKYDDAEVWGQWNHYLTISPSKNNKGKFTLQEKFGPYWSNDVQDAWQQLLGDMFNQNPRTYTGQKPTWAQTSKFLDDINVLTFRSGLTRLQLSNYLVTLKIIEPPSPDEMAQWIHKNHGLGASVGLQALGFHLSSNYFNTTRAAFTIVYRHLDENLTNEDKDLLHFGTIFVEHLLCKVTRWTGRYSKISHMLDELVARALQATWVSGENLTNSESFAFPITIHSDWMKNVIEDIKVFKSIQ